MHTALHLLAGPVLERARVLAEVVTGNRAHLMALPLVVARVLHVIAEQHDALSPHEVGEIQQRVPAAMTVMNDARVGRESRRVPFGDPVQAVPFCRRCVTGPLLGGRGLECRPPVVIPPALITGVVNREIAQLPDVVAAKEREALTPGSADLLRRQRRAGADEDYRPAIPFRDRRGHRPQWCCRAWH